MECIDSEGGKDGILGLYKAFLGDIFKEYGTKSGWIGKVCE